MKNLNNMVKVINENCMELAVNLYYRWQEEKDYEDINDYAKRFENEVKKYIKNVEKVTLKKRPFEFKIETEIGNVYLKVTATKTEMYTEEKTQELTEEQKRKMLEIVNKALKTYSGSYTKAQIKKIQNKEIEKARKIVLGV